MDIKCHLSSNESLSESRAFHEQIPEIVMIDSTEDESEHSMIKLKIKKQKTKKNYKKIKLSKKKILLESPVLQEIHHFACHTNAPDTFEKNEKNVEEKPILPRVSEKENKLGQKYQAACPPE